MKISDAKTALTLSAKLSEIDDELAKITATEGPHTVYVSIGSGCVGLGNFQIDPPHSAEIEKAVLSCVNAGRDGIVNELMELGIDLTVPPNGKAVPT